MQTKYIKVYLNTEQQELKSVENKVYFVNKKIG